MMKQPSCLIIAGEKSGEEHCLSFYDELKGRLPNYTFWGVGGDELKDRGMETLFHLKDFSSWGLSEVFKKIPFYFRAAKKIEHEVEKRGCKVAIHIDFQDFNLRMAKRLKKRGVQVFYYVAPQAWAWRPRRAKALAQAVHTLFCILPFEKKWFYDRGVRNVRAVPHPLLSQHLKELRERKHLEQNNLLNFAPPFKILLLPGSRDFEVIELLPLFLESLRLLPSSISYEVHLVISSSVKPGVYQRYIQKIDKIWSDRELLPAMAGTHVCVASSGTVTLRTALFGLPTVVCYRASLFTAFIFYNIIKYKGFASLANIIHQKEIFPELLQDEATPYNIKQALCKWLTDEKQYERIREELACTVDKISGDDFSLPDYLAQEIMKSYES